MSDTFEIVAEVGAELGEGPVWSDAEGALLFTDIIGRAILRWRVSDGQVDRVDLGARLGAFVPVADGDGFVGVVEQDVVRFQVDFDAGRAEREVISAGVVSTDEILNDGCCDPAGRFVFGSKALDESGTIASMLAFDGGGVSRLRENLIIFNGPAFSPTGDRVYFADSPTKTIFHAPYDVSAGVIGDVSIFSTLGADDGYPDGMAVDADGFLWNAHWDGSRVTRYAPDGSVDQVVATPAQRPTSLAFGGPDRRTLYATSAKRGTDWAEPLDAPSAGALMRLRVETPGASVAAFG